jgi:hypothetical protein
MTRITTTLRGLVLVACVMANAAVHADIRELPDGSAVRFQANPASELAQGWHSGTAYTADCVMVLTPDARMPRGQRVLGLPLIQKLERRSGAGWVEVPVKELMSREPKRCREAVGG